ncbi:hypothetical protein Q3A66_20735 [Hymenobacter sp. BT770]|uniref:hypothetical protein n=1 Tax=Hymenobacter sp. BT770 TaxID=2886942 RepID=UPI001D107796|nr:hypothetical protein [Hymenobacter sp. BT770]MCC3155494.1 hypothetical protein [Hymenobacter sp. BT770]MDO3417501.1 hypothetical protein [Hymenobacter sp. BT770]
MMKRLLLLPLLAGTLSTCREQPLAVADPTFTATVRQPTYGAHPPRILFDEGHNNGHTTRGTYRPFAALLEHDGCPLTVSDGPITGPALAGCDIYVVANARGTGDLNDTPAFTEPECAAIAAWVTQGGALLLIADHYPMGAAVDRLARKFGVQMQQGLVQDSVHHDPSSTDESQLVFSRANHLLAACALTEGVAQVVTYTGQSLRCDAPCVSFLNLSDAAYDLTARPVVVRDGPDTRVNVTFDHPQSAKGRSQGLARVVGQGRVVVLGEAAMLSAQLTRDHTKFGMNANPDNQQLALNIIHWLAARPAAPGRRE